MFMVHVIARTPHPSVCFLCGGPLPCRVALLFFFSSRRRHTRLQGDWSSDVCSSDLLAVQPVEAGPKILLKGNRGAHLHCLRHRRSVTIVAPHPPASAGASPKASTNSEIGRASCRERV